MALIAQAWKDNARHFGTVAVPRDVLLSCLKDERLAVADRCAQGLDERVWRNDVGKAEVLKDLIQMLENGAKAPDAVSGISIVT